MENNLLNLWDDEISSYNKEFSFNNEILNKINSFNSRKIGLFIPLYLLPLCSQVKINLLADGVIIQSLSRTNYCTLDLDLIQNKKISISVEIKDSFNKNWREVFILSIIGYRRNVMMNKYKKEAYNFISKEFHPYKVNFFRFEFKPKNYHNYHSHTKTVRKEVCRQSQEFTLDQEISLIDNRYKK